MEQDTCIPRFFIKAVKDEQKSKESGVTEFRDAEYVEIIIPNSRDTSVQPVGDQHKKRWPDHYRAFKEHREAPIVGTPLTEWAVASPSVVKSLESVNVRTIEALAEMPEQNLTRFGPDISKTIQKARAYVASKKDGGDISRMIEENERLKRALQDEKEENARLNDEIKKLKKKKAA